MSLLNTAQGATPSVGLTTVDPLLSKILSTRRCHGSPGDQQFRLWLAGSIKRFNVKTMVWCDNFIAVTDEKSDTLFSCHVDTVHNMAESHATSKQTLNFDANFELIGLDDKTSTCLGADDGAGIYIMLKMIEAKVPGTYVFHVGEERGGIGAKELANKHADWLRDNFSRAVAFDRPGDSEIITVQGGRVCASPEYAAALSIEFAKFGLDMKGSNRGVYTDTKEYAHLIPECINLGVGYHDQHGKNETLDYGHLRKLLNAALNIKWDAMVAHRKPVPNYPVAPTRNYVPSSFERMVMGGDEFNKSAPRIPGPAKKPPARKTLLQQMQGWDLGDFEDFCLTQDTMTVAAHIAFLFAAYAGNNAKNEVLKKTLPQG